MCETQRKNYCIPTNSTQNHHAQCISAMSVSLLNLHTTTKLPPVSKSYIRFQNYGKTVQAFKCIKSRIMTKVIDYVLSIDTFEKKCVVLKYMLKSPRLKDHVKTIGIDQSLRKNALFEHRFLQNIKKLYKHSGKCDNQQHFKDILNSTMIYTSEVFTNNSPISPTTPTPVKKPSCRKLLCLFTNILYSKKNTATRRFGAAKYKRKEVKVGTTPWALKPKRKVNSKINYHINKYLHNFIMHHPQVMQ